MFPRWIEWTEFGGKPCPPVTSALQCRPLMHSFSTDRGHGWGGRYGHRHLRYGGQKAKGLRKAAGWGHSLSLSASFLEDGAV